MPVDSSSHKVLVYPASGEKPYYTTMHFNSEGARYRHGYYTSTVDLRTSYGDFVCETRVGRMVLEDRISPCLNGEYFIYYNIDLQLPLNKAIAKVVGIKYNRPDPRPTWRGDAVIVKHQARPGHEICTYGQGEMKWLDVQPGGDIMELLGGGTFFEDRCDWHFKQWYTSEQWGNLIENEVDHLQALFQMDHPSE